MPTPDFRLLIYAKPEILDAALEAEERVLDEAAGAVVRGDERLRTYANGLGRPAFTCAPLRPAGGVAFGERRDTFGGRRARGTGKFVEWRAHIEVVAEQRS